MIEQPGAGSTADARSAAFRDAVFSSKSSRWPAEAGQRPRQQAVAELLGQPLPGVVGECRWRPEQPGAEPFRLCSVTGAGEPGARKMQTLIGKSAERPEQPVTGEVVHGGLAHRELFKFLDLLLDGVHGVAVPLGGHHLDAQSVSQDVGGLGELVGIEIEDLLFLQGVSSLQRQQPVPSETAGIGADGVRLLENLLGAAVFLPAAELAPDVPVARDLEEVGDLQLLERAHRSLRVEFLPSRTVISSTPTSRSQVTSSGSHLSMSSAAQAEPRHQRRPTRFSVSCIKTSNG